MVKITDLISKPSEALQAMIDGLLEQSKRKDFTIWMGSFGYVKEDMCYGCAATCAVQKIFNKNFEVHSITSRSFLFGISFCDLKFFEIAIDAARNGRLSSLFSYFHKDFSDRWENKWMLQDHNWREQLPLVQSAINEMKEVGL